MMTAITGFVRHLVEKKAIVVDFQLLTHTLIQETDDPTLKKIVVRNTRELALECLIGRSSATLGVFPRARTLPFHCSLAPPVQQKRHSLWLVIISSGMLIQGKNCSESRAAQVSAWHLSMFLGSCTAHTLCLPFTLHFHCYFS